MWLGIPDDFSGMINIISSNRALREQKITGNYNIDRTKTMAFEHFRVFPLKKDTSTVIVTLWFLWTKFGGKLTIDFDAVTGDLPLKVMLWPSRVVASWNSEGFHSHGGTPRAGWFISGKIPSRNGWFGGTPMLGNPHIYNIYIYICTVIKSIWHESNMYVLSAKTKMTN